MVTVDQFFGGRRRRSQDAKPGEGKNSLIHSQSIRYARAAHSVKAVAPGNKIANYLRGFAGIIKTDFGSGRIEIMNGDVLSIEHDFSPVFESRGNEILHDLLLRIDGD